MTYTRLSLATYIVLLLVGGIMGYAFSGSVISLIASSLFSALLLGSLVVSYRWPSLGLRGSLVVLILLTIFFGYRWILTAALFPAGVFTCLSALLTLGVVYALTTVPRESTEN